MKPALVRRLLTPALLAVVAAAAALPAAAQTAPAAATAADMADAEVRKVDKDASKLTLKHGEIKSLDMPPMTMVFTVRDKALLDKVKVGDRIRFRAVNQSGQYLVTELVVVP